MIFPTSTFLWMVAPAAPGVWCVEPTKLTNRLLKVSMELFGPHLEVEDRTAVHHCQSTSNFFHVSLLYSAPTIEGFHPLFFASGRQTFLVTLRLLEGTSNIFSYIWQVVSSMNSIPTFSTFSVYFPLFIFCSTAHMSLIISNGKKTISLLPKTHIFFILLNTFAIHVGTWKIGYTTNPQKCVFSSSVSDRGFAFWLVGDSELMSKKNDVLRKAVPDSDVCLKQLWTVSVSCVKIVYDMQKIFLVGWTNLLMSKWRSTGFCSLASKVYMER